MIQIIIADDHQIVREGLKKIVTGSQGMRVAGEASDGQSLLDKVRKKDYDVILLDISMPGRNGLDILKQIKSFKPHIPVLVLSMHPEEHYALRTIRAGASGYLTKDSASDRLIEAIKRVHTGGKYISPSLAETLAESLTMDFEHPLHEQLSDREYQVLCAIASGNSVSEIARQMFLSVKTISTYRKRILDKMHMKNNSELTHYCVTKSLI